MKEKTPTNSHFRFYFSINFISHAQNTELLCLAFQVEDGGEPGRYDTSSVSILIGDANDNAPIFEHSPYTVSF